MNNIFEMHTENLMKNLNSIEKYMTRFKGSIMSDFDELFDSAFEVINKTLPFKDIANQAIDRTATYMNISREELLEKEFEIDIEMNSFGSSMLEVTEILEENGQLMKTKGEENYEEVRIHIYSLFIYVIAIFEDYLKKVLQQNSNLNELLNVTKQLFEYNNINYKDWNRKIRRFQGIRNKLVHKIGEINSNDYLYITVKKDIKPLLSTINEFIDLYRLLIDKQSKNLSG
ncbi:hypothetical protein AK95_16305 [Paenibacillus sp. LC231]|uniref:hypothetical protein n=1 Tax=Paenibacillus sp. LC231 TaxID=1120679 RepID=UPI0008DE5C12|nr:hypothetical protein [Paenibacillus sp. LC231]OIA98722.1 hypothetical protein AK95_16305 [Paenibacillus sp. LC231]